MHNHYVHREFLSPTYLSTWVPLTIPKILIYFIIVLLLDKFLHNCKILIYDIDYDYPLNLLLFLLFNF